MLPVNLLVEGLTDGIVLKRVMDDYPLLSASVSYGMKGLNYIREKIVGFSRAAQPAQPMVCLVDLDRHPCPVTLVSELLPQGVPSGFVLRVAVRAVEAWLLADSENFARFANLPVVKIPSAPEDDPDPKSTLIDLVRRHGKPALQRDIVPDPGSSARVGKAYAARIHEFVTKSWDPLKAEQASPSLARARAALMRLVPAD